MSESVDRGAVAGKRAWRRLACRAGAALLAMALLASAGLAWLLFHLDSPWVKRRLLAQLSAATGLEVDYGSLELRPLSGLRLGGLEVRSPVAFRAVAPELLRLERLEVEWSLRRGPGDPWVRSVGLHGVSVAIVEDDLGQSSLQLLLPPAPSEPAQPATPLSRLPSKIFRGTPPVGRVDVDGISLASIRLEQGRVTERWSVSGLALQAQTEAAGEGWRARLSAGAETQPLEVALRHEAGGKASSARAAVRTSVEAAEASAAASVDVQLIGQDLVALPAIHRLAHLELSARFEPQQARTEVRLEQLQAGDGAMSATAELELPDGPASPLRLPKLDGRVELGRLLAALPPGLVPVRIRSGWLTWSGRDVALSAGAASGKLTAQGRLSGLSVSLGGEAVEVAAADLSLDALPAWSPTVLSPQAHGKLSLRGFELSGGGRRVILDRIEGDLSAVKEAKGWRAGAALRFGRLLAPPLSAADGGVDVTLSDLRVDLLRPLSTTGTLEVGVQAGSLQVGGPRPLADVSGLDAHVHLRLGGREPWSGEVVVPADRLKLFDGRGRLRFSDRFRLEARLSDLLVDALHPLSTRGSVHADLSAGPLRGSAVLHALGGGADLELSARTGTLAPLASFLPPSLGLPWGRMTLDLKSQAKVDVAARSARLSLDVAGTAVPKGHLAAAMSVGKDGKMAAFQLGGRLEGLVALRPLLAKTPLGSAEADLGRTAVAFDSRGSITGLLAIQRGGALRIPAEPPAAWRGEGVADVQLSRLQVGGPQWEGVLPAGSLHLDVRVPGGRTSIEGELRLEATDVQAAAYRASLHAVRDRFRLQLDGSPGDGVGELTNDLSVGELRQDAAKDVPPADLGLGLSVSRGRDGVVQISRLELQSRRVGSRASLTGALVLGRDRRKLSLKGEVAQDLAQLSRQATHFSGRGDVGVTFHVASPDLGLFRTDAIVSLHGVDLAIPGRHVSVEALEGRIPVSVDLALTDGSLHFLRDAVANPYSQLRFADQHPLLSNSGFVSLGRLTTPDLEIAPLFANLRVQRNQVALSQLELGVRGGRVSGQCLLDWKGDDTLLDARVRATGVLSSHGEPFDGNASIVASLRDRSLDGRAEIVRIGRRHLLDLLDVQDPQHSDPAINRIRSALALGYPDRVRLLFDHGFASVLVTLGGLGGRFVHIDELRGIPTEPIVDQILASLAAPAEDR